MGKSGTSKKDNAPKTDDKGTIKTAIITGVVSVLVAVVGCLGSVTVASIQGIGPFAKWFLERTPVPTVIVTSSPTFPATSMSDPTAIPNITEANLPCNLNHNCLASMDWVNDCIAAYNWTVYSSSDFPTVQQDGLECYSQPILDVFFTKDGGLYILAQPKNLIASKDYGIFTPLPQKGKISLTLDLDKLDNGQVWVGVFEQPTINKSKGILLVAPPGDVKAQAFALKTMPDQAKVEISQKYQNPSGIYTLGFELEYGSIIANVEGTSMTSVPFTSPNRWLFIGYRAKVNSPDPTGSADIQALLTNLVIEQ